jgi:hypothetical protein
MNICTDLTQSNELTKMLPLESSDMHYSKHPIENYYSPIPIIGKYSKMQNEIPCWSLSALMHIISQYSDYTIDVTNGKIVAFVSPFNSYNVIRYENTQLVDLCVDIIRKLNNYKLL